MKEAQFPARLALPCRDLKILMLSRGCNEPSWQRMQTSCTPGRGEALPLSNCCGQRAQSPEFHSHRTWAGSHVPTLRCSSLQLSAACSSSKKKEQNKLHSPRYLEAHELLPFVRALLQARFRQTVCLETVKQHVKRQS